MAQNTPLTEQEKQKVSDALTVKLIAGLEQGELDTNSSADVCGYLLDNFKTVQTRGQLLQLLQYVSGKWPVFMSVYQDEKKKDLIGQIEVELTQITNKQQA